MKEMFGAEKRTWLLAALAFSAGAFLVRWAGFTVPVAGTGVNFDPRELFVTLGASITGPLGGVIIGLFAGLPTESLADMVAHVTGGVLIGFLYRPLHHRWRVPKFLLGWVLLLAAYYYVFLIPAFLVTTSLTASPSLSDLFGSELSFFQAYTFLGQVVLPEFVTTLIVTVLILVGLSEKYRRPLWWTDRAKQASKGEP